MNPLLDMLAENTTMFVAIAQKIDRKFNDLIAVEKDAYPLLRNYWKHNTFNATDCEALLAKMATGKEK